MSSLQDEIIAEKGRAYTDALQKSMRQTMDDLFTKAYDDVFRTPAYYSKRKYGKWTIYNKDGWRVAWGLNEREMNNYMKLLKEEK